MSDEIRQLNIPDLWFDFYARLLPGTAFGGMVWIFGLNKAISSVSDIAVIVTYGYLAALIIQPLGSILAHWVEYGFERLNKHDGLYVKRMQKKLGADTRSAMILGKMHGEVTFFTQLAFLCIVYLFTVDNFLTPNAPPFGCCLLLSLFLFFIASSCEVAYRRLTRAEQHEKLSAESVA